MITTAPAAPITPAQLAQSRQEASASRDTVVAYLDNVAQVASNAASQSRAVTPSYVFGRSQAALAMLMPLKTGLSAVQDSAEGARMASFEISRHLEGVSDPHSWGPPLPGNEASHAAEDERFHSKLLPMWQHAQVIVDQAQAGLDAAAGAGSVFSGSMSATVAVRDWTCGELDDLANEARMASIAYKTAQFA